MTAAASATGPAAPSAQATSTAAAPVGVCSLITQSEASAAFGAPSSSPQPAQSAQAGGKACAYFASQQQDSLQVALLTGASHAQFTTIRNSIQIPGGATKTLPGIGDEAMSISAGPTTVVVFRKGLDVVVITLNLLGGGVTAGPATTLAKDAAGRL